MTGAGQQFLASAGFALDQQRRIEGRHAPRLANHSSHDLRALKDAVEATQLLLAHMVDALADPIRAVQRQHGPGHGFAVVMFRLQRCDVGKKHIAAHLDPQAIDPRLAGAYQLWQVEIFGVTRQGHARHFIDPHTQQLRGGTIGRNDRPAHVDGQHREFQRAEQGIELHVPALAGHQPDTFDAEHPGDRLELRAQGLELQVDQVRAMQIDRVTVFAPHFAARHVDAVSHQQIENVAKNADAVLAVHLDAHESSSL